MVPCLVTFGLVLPMHGTLRRLSGLLARLPVSTCASLGRASRGVGLAKLGGFGSLRGFFGTIPAMFDSISLLLGGEAKRAPGRSARAHD